MDLTTQAREALLFAELVAWTQNHSSIDKSDLLGGICLQRGSIGKKLANKLNSEFFEVLGASFFSPPEHGEAVVRFNFKKIPFNDEVLDILNSASALATEFSDDGKIHTGFILIACLLKIEEFTSLFVNETGEKSLKERLLKWIEHCSFRYLQNKETGDDLTQTNIQILEWLRNGNLAPSLMKESGLEPDAVYSFRPCNIFKIFEDDYKDYVELKPPLKSGIADKSRRELETMDNFVSASALQDSAPDLLGIYMDQDGSFILFFEESFALSDEESPIKYSEIESVDCQEIETDTGSYQGSLQITLSNKTLQLQLPGYVGSWPDAYRIHDFLDSTLSPQSISEINSDLDLVSFFKRQNHRMDLYEKLCWKLNHDLCLWGEDPEREDTALFRFMAILYTEAISVKIAGWQSKKN